MGPNLLALLSNFWSKLQLVPRQGGFHRRPIWSERGVTQGDPLSLFIFNIVVDAVVRKLRTRFPLGDLFILFYADDGWLASYRAEVHQQAIDTVTDLFRRMGLKMNANKTSHPSNAVHSIASPVFARVLLAKGLRISLANIRRWTAPNVGSQCKSKLLPNTISNNTTSTSVLKRGVDFWILLRSTLSNKRQRLHPSVF
jgi:Reverse transcriptase (RNA-dependent DNA polymerase)